MQRGKTGDVHILETCTFSSTCRKDNVSLSLLHENLSIILLLDQNALRFWAFIFPYVSDSYTRAEGQNRPKGLFDYKVSGRPKNLYF